MKCKREECSYEAAPGQVYCSRECAPYGNYGVNPAARHTPSVRRMATSTTKAPGAASPPAKKEGKPTWLEQWRKERTQLSQQKSEQAADVPTIATSKESESVSVSSGTETPNDEPDKTPHASSGPVVIESTKTPKTESGTMPTSKKTEGKNESESGAATPPVDSTALSLILEKDKSASENLIVDSVRHLHGLLKSVKASSDDRPLSPQHINAAVSCARGMQGLMKLQLDAFKALKGKGA